MLYNGKLIDPFPFPSNLKFFEDIQFRPGMKGTSKQSNDWRGLTIHWTGGEGKAPAVTKTLKDSGLSVHFVVDPDGSVTQLADLNTRCSHCGVGNSYFIGVEVVCRGYANMADLNIARLKDPGLRERTELDWSAERDVYSDIIANERVNMASFNPAQITAVVWLAEALSRQFNFPRRIPSRVCKDTRPSALAHMPVKDPKTWLVLHGDMLWLPAFDRDTIWRPKNFRGVIPHFAIHETKHDCGTGPLYALWRNGWNPAEVLLPDAE